MDTKEIEFFRTVLTKRLDDLLHQAGTVVSELISQSSQEIEYLDRAATDTDQLLKLRIRSRESRLIRKIREALGRLDNNTYGICETCGDDISFRRLEARPVTTKCISCKELEEEAELTEQEQ